MRIARRLAWRRSASAGLLLLALLGPPACTPNPRLATVPSHPSRSVAALRSDLERVFGAPVYRHALWAVHIESLDTGEILYRRNPDTLVSPASNMKILTLGAAAERLGWDHRFETRVVSGAPIEDGVLRGDLVVVGGGDPSIGGRVFDQWAARLRALGIRTIDGRIVGDDDAFDDEGLGAGWAWDDLAYGYAAPVGALAFNESVVQLEFRPGLEPGDPVAVAVSPGGSALTIVSRVVTAAPEDRPALDLRRRLGDSHLEIVGAIPAGARPLTQTASVDNPTLFFVRALREALLAGGIEVRGDAVDIDDVADVPGGFAPSGVRALLTWPSPPLAEIAKVLMKVSQNLYAETLLKTLGRTAGTGTTEGGRQVVRKVLDAWGVAPDTYVQYDGSGLSRYNYVTADTIVAILCHLYKDPAHRDRFVATLPVAGMDGTIAERMRGTPAEGNVRAKTGTIANVRALSGFVTTKDGERLAFSIIANHFTLRTALVDYGADLAVEMLANFTRR